MIQLDEDALICDLAETYRIYDYRQLPMLKVAVFSFGLRDTSRIKMALSQQKIDTDTLLLAGMQDALNLLVWSKTQDAQNGGNPPKSIVKAMIDEPIEKEERIFETGEDFELARQKLLKEIGGF